MRRHARPSPSSRRLPSFLTLGFAGALSLAWFILVWGYVGSDPGWQTLRTASPEAMATFLAAAAGPLAVIWLVAAFILTALALFQTQADVRIAQRQAVRTTEEIEALVRTSIEMQEQARRQSFLNGVELALKDLNSQAGMITGRLGVLNAEETEYLWALNAAGDPWAFCHALLERSELEDGFVDFVAHRVAGDDVASAGLHRFMRRYERLLTLAKDYDVDKLVREVLEDGPLDRLYSLFQVVSAHVQAILPAEPPSNRTQSPDRSHDDSWPEDGGAATHPSGEDPPEAYDWDDRVSASRHGTGAQPDGHDPTRRWQHSLLAALAGQRWLRRMWPLPNAHGHVHGHVHGHGHGHEHGGGRWP